MESKENLTRNDPSFFDCASRKTSQSYAAAFSSQCQVIKAQAAVHRCSAEVDLEGSEHPSIPPTVNDERIYKHAHRVSTEVVGEENTVLSPSFTGSEDFAFYLDEVPGSFLFLGIRNEKIGSVHPPHSPYYSIDEDVLSIGTAIHAAFALSYVSDSTRTANSDR